MNPTITESELAAPTGSVGLDVAIGSLLDEWDRVPNDLKWGSDLVRLRSKIEALERVACSRQPPNAVQAAPQQLSQ